MKTMTNLQIETMAHKLIIDCIASRRVENGMADIMNCFSGGDRNQWEHEKHSNTLSVAIDLLLLEDMEELRPYLVDYFYSAGVDVSGHKKAEVLAYEVMSGWGKLINDYAKLHSIA